MNRRAQPVGGVDGLEFPRCPYPYPNLPEFPRLGLLLPGGGSFGLLGGGFFQMGSLVVIVADVEVLAKAIAQHPKAGAALTDELE